MFRPSRARGALLLVAFSVLASTAAANAECAWVLWQERTVNEKSEWSVIQARPRESDCSDAQKAKLQYLADEAKPKLIESGNFIYGKYGREYVSYRVICLRDTMDPRRPKAK